MKDRKQLQEKRQHGLKNGELQAKIWNAKAAEFAAKPIPELQTDSFLQYIQEKMALSGEISVLDIGCGAGGYCLALAPYVKRVVGTDISEKMIEEAEKRAAGLGLANVSFFAQDWSSVDTGDFTDGKGFELVFAHMTPAICDYETMDKLLECAKEHCFLVKPARRKDSVLDRVFSLIGLPPQSRQMDGIVLYCFSFLWLKGYCPEMSYRDTVWQQRRTVGEMTAWCTDRAKLQKELTEEEERRIVDYIEEISTDGYVTETVTSTIVTIYWHM